MVKTLKYDNPGGSLECKLTGRCPISTTRLGKKIYISIPCVGIFRLQNNRKAIGKTIAFVLEQIVITRFGISDQFSYPVQEFILKNDTL